MMIRYALVFGMMAASGVTSSGVAAQEASLSPVTVTFGIGREAFDEAGIDTLSAASHTALRDGYGSMTVDGHTDTLGEADFNAGLSLRRATVIRRELMARGVQPEVIRIAAFGQTDLAVATGDGVAEAANRRVVIALDAAGAFPAPDPLTPYAFPLP